MNELQTIEPPEDIKQDLAPITTWAKSLKIATAEAFADAGERLKQIKGMSSRITAFFKPLKQKQDEAKKAILDAERKLTEPLAEAEGLAKRAMLAYQQAEQKKADDQRRELQAKADAIAEQERKEALAKAAKAKKPETKEKYVEQAAAVSAPVVHVPVSAPKVQGVTVTKTWTFEVVDSSLVPDMYKIINEKALGTLARSLKEQAVVPGVRFFATEGISSRGA